jgi:hypothetical protein
MTSLGAIRDWLVASKALGRAAVRRGDEADYRLRSLPKEDIYLHVKAIDNSRVVRVVDHKDWWASLGMSVSVLFSSLLLIALLLPGGYSLLASRRMERLRTDRERLVNELRILRVEEAKTLNPHQLEVWAGSKFVDPPASSLVFAPPVRGTVAALDQR